MLYIDITRLYNNQRLGKTMTGVDKVSMAYVEAFCSIACAVIRLPKEWLFFPLDKSRTLFEHLLDHQPIKPPSFLDKKRYKNPAQDQQSYLLNTAHSGLETPLFRERMRQYGLRGIYFLHDLIPTDYPEYCRDGEYKKHYQRLLTMIQGDLIIANSQYSQDRFYNFCHQQGFMPPQTIWAHLGTSTLPKAQTISVQDKVIFELILSHRPYFVILGTIESRKNHLFLLNLWRELLQELGDNCPKLVIIGKRGWECEQVIDILDRSIELKSVMVELNHCEDAQVGFLIRQAQALLFPSWVEGFGLPLIEAFAAHIPVIANDIPVFREINVCGAELCSVTDGKRWKQLIYDYMSLNSNRRMMQLASIKANYHKIPTWDAHFEQVKPVIAQQIR